MAHEKNAPMKFAMRVKACVFGSSALDYFPTLHTCSSASSASKRPIGLSRDNCCGCPRYIILIIPQEVEGDAKT